MKAYLRLALLLLPLCGCAYFNGMYNARRLSNGARKAEREGRSFEANRLWGLASTKAESLQAQHPKSKYVPEARLIQASALARTGDCDNAVPLAERALSVVKETRLVEDAALLLARCSEQRNDPAAALESYGRLMNSTDQARRREAIFRHARAERILGMYQEAFNDLAGSTHPQASGERAATLMALGRKDDAVPIVDSLIAAHDSLVPWNDLIESYGKIDTAGASDLVNRLARDSSFKAAARVEWVVGDAERLAQSNPAAAMRRLTLADSLGSGPSLRSRRAKYEMTRAQLAQVGELAELQPMIDRLTDLGEMGGPSAPLAYRTARNAQLVLASVDSAQQVAPQYDLRLFYAAEVARDSLGARRLAASLFRQMVTGWPDSPYAPKAALAMVQMAPDETDSTSSTVLARSAQSPYLLVLRGDDPPGYRQLEDSLRVFMRGFRPSGDDRRPRPGARPGARPGNREVTPNP